MAVGGPVVRAYVRSAIADRVFETCARWPSGRASPIENEPFAPAAPQLVLVGEFDASLSRLAGRAIVARGRRAHEVLFRRQGHVQFRERLHACAAAIVARFLDDPNRVIGTRCARDADAIRYAPLSKFLAGR